MKICVIIPTLNEEKNIEKTYLKIKKTKIKSDILFVDDNSTDNSQKIIINLSKKFKNVDYLFRKNKTGIGSAHKDAIKLIYKKWGTTIEYLPDNESKLAKVSHLPAGMPGA